jgi:glutathione S-transferase
LRRPGAFEFMNKKLDALAKRLGDKPFLDGEHFTAGDLMMATVLRFHSDTSKFDPRLVAYLDRCTSRPAFKRALDAQLADFRSAAA